MAIKPCCADLSNRTAPEPHGNGTVQRCSVCGLRHFGLELDAMNLRKPGPPVTIGSITLRLMSDGTRAVDVQNVKRDKARLLGLLDEAKAIVEKMQG